MPLRWRSSARRGFAAVVAVVVVALLVGLLIDQVSWSRTDGTVRAFDAVVRVRADGSIRVRETVRLRIGRPERAPAEQRVLRTYAQGRRLEVSDIRLRGEDGRKLRPEVAELLGARRLRFELPGDPAEASRRYLLSYTVTGSATPLSSQTLLEHDLLGRGLGREVESVRVTVRGGNANTAGCLTGPSDRRRFCSLTQRTADRVVFGEDDLGASDGLAFSVRFEPALPDVPPVRPTDPPVATGTTVLLRVSLALSVLLMIGAAAMLRQRSRPRTWLRPWRGQPEPPVGVRPGEAGALLAGAAGPEHLTATLFDLVRRGHLHLDGSGDQAVLRQPATPSGRDELELYEWSLLLKVFARNEAVTIADVRAAAPAWSYELLRELERQVVEGSGWRRGARVTRLQRVGWLVAMGLVLAGYLAMAVLSVTSWPELPIRDLVSGALVTVLWSAGCAELASRTVPGALTLRGRLVFAEVDAWARHVDRRGVDDDDPAMGIWAVALAVRPDPIGLPVVPPSERPEQQGDEDGDDVDLGGAERDTIGDADRDVAGSRGRPFTGTATGTVTEADASGELDEMAGPGGHDPGIGATGRADGERPEVSETDDGRVPSGPRIFDDDDDLPLP